MLDRFARHGRRARDLVCALTLVVATNLEPGEVERRPGVAIGKRGAVAAEHRLAAEAGVEMLAAGGNAIDAAVATAFAIGVVNPSSCGIGGGGFLLAYTASDDRIRALDFRERAPEAAHRDVYVRDGKVDSQASLRGALAVAVPGEIRGLSEAQRTLGTLPLARVLEPAIRLAGGGFPVGEHLAEVLAEDAEAIRANPDLAAIYLKPDGVPFKVGERLVQRDLAKTLKVIAEEGPDAFYSGEIAEQIVETVTSGGGLVSKRDLLAYRTAWREPLVVPYRGFEVVGFPPPSSGGGVILEILRVLGGYERSRDGTAAGMLPLHLIAEASKLAFADRALHYGDPDYVKVPLERLLSDAHAADLRKRISAERTSPARDGATPAADAGTAHLSTIDAAGNAAALTTTINTAFGSMVVARGTGIVLNNQMDDFAAAPGVANVYGLIGAEANSIRAGKRPLSSMSPTLVRRAGEVELALGGSGGPFIISGTLQTLLRVVDDGLSLDEAIAAPRIHHQWKPDRLLVERDLPKLDRDNLRRLGHELVEVEGIGAVQGVARTAEGFIGAADLRKGGDAAAW